jgi:hypothetical protein
MSFARSFEEAHSIQTAIQLEKTDGRSDGPSSPIYMGSATSGVTETVSNMNENAQTKHSDETMTQLRTKLHVRTSSLQRKYASTGS